MDRNVQLAAGRRLVVQALGLVGVTIALNITAAVLKSPAVGFLAGLAGLLALTFAIVAVFRVGEQLGYSMLIRVVLAMIAVLPALNIVMLVVLYVRTTKSLRAAGVS
jgi:hypothetical protein